ncbi:cytochrome c oxidase accessory protein FixG [Paucibacter oligotrophus]|uniref:Cytochrome c oxidase accessory protein FixG n=1 Tax=Roseateles oligotrophus TaxID=1769250 RepID=A0A840LF25_9BURK|nr:cytochrome c oxidase accessory protein CcoG [Roseateles oligotrophus]MBB4845242.1 cytochrome c oxidase accessory protein FixG [Roseateles oligotrophus]
MTSTRQPVIPIHRLLPELQGFEAAHKVQVRSMRGRFSRLRSALVLLTQLVFLGLPWLQINGRQAVRFDLEAQRFYLFKLVLAPQDLIYLTGLLVISALLLFFVTALLGRVWCGFACPQTVYTQLFLGLEKRFEGERHLRLRLDRAGWGPEKLARRGGKHLAWLLLSLWVGLSFVGWFSPMREVASQLMSWELGRWEAFWALFYGGFTYLNAGLLREKICQHICPYGRFQGAMLDADTLLVSYDARRGEPRGKQATAKSSGACVDCSLCVQVCPVGIDIRQGVQSACISCAVCIDACDQVMDKLQAPRGLIRFASENGARAVAPSPLRGLLARPRVRIYGGLLLGLCLAMAWGLAQRPELRLDVIRDRGVMARQVDEGAVENIYRLQVVNLSESPRHISLQLQGLAGGQLIGGERWELRGGEARSLVLAVRLPAREAQALRGQGGGRDSRSHAMAFSIRNAQGDEVSAASSFVVPR